MSDPGLSDAPYPRGPTIDQPERGIEIARILERKPFLRQLYGEIYSKFRDCLARCPPAGLAVELGSGQGLGRDAVADVLRTDVLPYRDLDVVMDGRALPFQDASLRAVFMLNVFHHVPDPASMLGELQRCLKPGGRALICDQYPGWISTPIYRWAHHEGFDMKTPSWSFDSTGPLSGANGALAWIVFERDRARFSTLFPALQIEGYERHTPLRYWVSGGLKPWTLVPGFAYGFATWLDRALLRLSPRFASFVDIELVRGGG